MAQSTGRKLDSGEAFPDLTVNLLDGKQTKVAAHMQGKWGALLLYRGDW